jgi:hypothetical protein
MKEARKKSEERSFRNARSKPLKEKSNPSKHGRPWCVKEKKTRHDHMVAKFGSR